MNIINAFLYFKLCTNRALSHLGSIKNVLEIALLLAIWLGVTKKDLAMMTALCVIGILLVFLVGHVDVKSGVAAREASLGNRYNPELQTLLKRKTRRR